VHETTGKLRAAVAALLAALLLGGCTAMDDFFARITFLNTMRWSPAFDPYQNPRPAAPGSVPFESPAGAVPLPPVQPTEASLNQFAARMVNPVAGDTATLERGRLMYERYCLVCHGAQGDGRGPVIGPGRFPFATDLRLPATAQRTDGYLYGVIIAGRGLMPAYRAQTTHMDRWYMVNYVRSLQQQPAETAGAALDPTTPGQGTD
jgi:mono/diheme cytochrome c family protein